MVFCVYSDSTLKRKQNSGLSQDQAWMQHVRLCASRALCRGRDSALPTQHHLGTALAPLGVCYHRETSRTFPLSCCSAGAGSAQQVLTSLTPITELPVTSVSSCFVVSRRTPRQGAGLSSFTAPQFIFSPVGISQYPEAKQYVGFSTESICQITGP